MSLPAWGVWIEIVVIIVLLFLPASLPAWGVWIEIVLSYHQGIAHYVTPRMGSVD